MDLPKSLKIGGLNYRVTVLANLPNSVPGTMGNQNANYASINISSYLREDVALSTLLHECLHAISLLGSDLSEKQIGALEMVLLGLFRENPALFECLVEPLKKLPSKLTLGGLRYTVRRRTKVNSDGSLATENDAKGVFTIRIGLDSGYAGLLLFRMALFATRHQTGLKGRQLMPVAMGVRMLLIDNPELVSVFRSVFK